MSMKATSKSKGAKSKDKSIAVEMPEDQLDTIIEDAAVGEQGEGTQIAGTHSAQAVLLLQKLLPLARVVYVSATGASEPEHLLYASRLGLWGTGEMPISRQICHSIFII